MRASQTHRALLHERTPHTRLVESQKEDKDNKMSLRTHRTRHAIVQTAEYHYLISAAGRLYTINPFPISNLQGNASCAPQAHCRRKCSNTTGEKVLCVGGGGGKRYVENVWMYAALFPLCSGIVT